MCAACRLKNIKGMVVVRIGDDGDVLANIPDGKGYAGIDHVIVGGHDQRRILDAQAVIGLRVSVVTVDNFIP